MTTPISPEAQALLDADIAVAEAGLDDTAFMAAADARRIALAAYQATLAPKECRPPADAKDGDLFWLVNDISGTRASVLAQLKPGTHWLFVLQNTVTAVSFSDAHSNGWTVHSACTFPGERVEATEREVFYLAQYCGFAIPAIGGGTKYKFKNTPELLAYTQAALRHFFPTLRPVSDEKIEELRAAYIADQAYIDRKLSIRLRLAIRAVLAFERGTG